MKGLSLFSGIGGLDLAAEAAGIEVTGMCEMAEYPQQALPLLAAIVEIDGIIANNKEEEK